MRKTSVKQREIRFCIVMKSTTRLCSKRNIIFRSQSTYTRYRQCTNTKGNHSHLRIVNLDVHLSLSINTGSANIRGSFLREAVAPNIASTLFLCLPLCSWTAHWRQIWCVVYPAWQTDYLGAELWRIWHNKIRRVLTVMQFLCFGPLSLPSSL